MDKNWQAIGEQMPYFGVISAENLKPGAVDQAAMDEFFASGERHVDIVLDWIRRYVDDGFQPGRCLDFGCGVGRLAIPLAKRFREVVGADVSEGMLKEARSNSAKLGLANVEFVLSDDELSQVKGAFDLIHSFIVIQHIPPARGEKIFDELLKRLNPNGVGVLHVMYGRQSDRISEAVVRSLRSIPLVNGLINLAKGRNFRYPHIPMNAYDLNKLMRKVQDAGCDRIFVAFTQHGGALGVALTFRKGPIADPPRFP